MPAIAKLKEKLEVGAPIVRHNLAIFPLFDETAAAATDYVGFGNAQKNGLIRVTEVSASGSVSQLAVEILSETGVLLLDGEELIGAKQNRIVNLTILAAGKTTVAIPVSCVEQDRWSAASREFSESPQTMYPRGRAKKMMAVSASLMCAHNYYADQGEIWDDVDQRASELGIASPTRAMKDIFDQHQASLAQYLDGITWIDGQVGAAFAINGKPVGVEVFESHSIASEYLPKIIRSYALDAIAHRRLVASPHVDAAEVSRLIDRITAADAQTFLSVGIGTDFRIDSTEIAGAALVRDESVVHLSAFMKSITNG
jgi:hypothetical protein